MPDSFYYRPRCVFCDKNSKLRHSKSGRYWTCDYCGELNPGHSMLKSMVTRFLHQGGHAAAGNGEAPKAATTKIKGAAEVKPAAKTAATSTPTPEAPVPTKPAPPIAPPKPEKKRSFIYG